MYDCEATDVLQAQWDLVSQDAYDEEAVERLRSNVGSVGDAAFLEYTAYGEHLFAIMQCTGSCAVEPDRVLYAAWCMRHGGVLQSSPDCYRSRPSGRFLLALGRRRRSGTRCCASSLTRVERLSRAQVGWRRNVPS